MMFKSIVLWYDALDGLYSDLGLAGWLVVGFDQPGRACSAVTSRVVIKINTERVTRRRKRRGGWVRNAGVCGKANLQAKLPTHININLAKQTRVRT